MYKNTNFNGTLYNKHVLTTYAVIAHRIGIIYNIDDSKGKTEKTAFGDIENCIRVDIVYFYNEKKITNRNTKTKTFIISKNFIFGNEKERQNNNQHSILVYWNILLMLVKKIFEKDDILCEKTNKRITYIQFN